MTGFSSNKLVIDDNNNKTIRSNVASLMFGLPECAAGRSVGVAFAFERWGALVVVVVCNVLAGFPTAATLFAMVLLNWSQLILNTTAMSMTVTTTIASSSGQHYN